MTTTILVLCAAMFGGTPTTEPARYSNELPGFRFHTTAKWNKLVPLQSDFNDVRKVMGDPTNFAEAAGYFYPNQGHPESKVSLFWYDLDDDWQMIVYFVRFDSQDYAKQYHGKIETLDLIPRKAMQMTGIKELAKLKKKHVRAADAAWDEYSDGSGLKYEVYTSKLPSWFKEGPGDLNRIVYGAPDEAVAKSVAQVEEGIRPAQEGLLGSVAAGLREVDSTDVFDGHVAVCGRFRASLVSDLATFPPSLVSRFDLVVGRFLVLDARAIRKEQWNHATSVIGIPSATAPIEIAPIMPSSLSSQLSHIHILWGGLPDVRRG